MELCDQPIHVLFKHRLAGETTAVQIVNSVLTRIDKMEPRLNAYITLTRDGMIENAEAADRRQESKGRCWPGRFQRQRRRVSIPD